MHAYLIEMLECPVCHDELEWRISRRRGERIESAEARCQGCAAVYPVLEGVGLFLTPDPPRNDLWGQVDSQLAKYLREHSEVEQRLMDVSADELAPADLFYRALVLEERGEYEAAKELEEQAKAGIYTEGYLACSESQRNYVIERLSESDGPIVDTASGRCYLVEEMARRLECLIVATDLSPRVLRQDRRRLESFGLYDKISLLAFDARRTPFRNGAVGTLTTNVGLSNIEEPGNLLSELRRVVGGQFLAISHFYPEGDEVNAMALREAGLSSLIFRNAATDAFIATGWEVGIVNECSGRAEPTPKSEVLGGAQVDAFPVQETMLQWGVIMAR
ncbi:MAG: Ubiquinone/menaquinone biosynthesis C-methyltransferase UbiE [Anaerolineales bacterium]|nr:Ubiquinone/menaquinone biosynthesis C-methyltransferase UbiE [Anaerolineales bacterium]